MTTRSEVAFAYEVMVAGQLASVLEVSGWPKPGNVHRTRDLPDVRYEHFLAGAVALGPSLREATLRGIDVGKKIISPSNVGVGGLIKRYISEVRLWHRGGNTHLGTCMLLIPLAASAGKTYVEDGYVTPMKLRLNTLEITSNTTTEDAVDVYEAIRLSGTEGTLGEVSTAEAPDVLDREYKWKIVSQNLTLYDVMKVASEWDSVASEFTSGMKTVFDLGYPSITDVFNSTRDINIAIVHTYLKILHRVPDTFISRKVGLKETSDVKEAVKRGLKNTMWVSQEAGRILEAGGLLTEKGRGAIWSLDEKLHESGGELNPGTTADILAASIMVAILCGMRY